MAITLSTTAAAAIGRNDTIITVTAATNAAVGMICKMEEEYALVQAVNGTAITVARLGLNGSAVKAHGILSPVEISAGSDFPAYPVGSDIPIPYSAPLLATYGAAGAILVPTEDFSVFLVAGTAAAMTLPLPSTALDGIKGYIQAGAAQAYTVTVPSATGYKNTTGTATFGGAIGDAMIIQAFKGQWLPLAVTNVTFA